MEQNIYALDLMQTAHRQYDQRIARDPKLFAVSIMITIDFRGNIHKVSYVEHAGGREPLTDKVVAEPLRIPYPCTRVPVTFQVVVADPGDMDRFRHPGTCVSRVARPR